MLDERDKSILDFEREWWQHPGAKEDAIRQTFGFSPTRYYQLLSALVTSREAMEYDPMLVKRLQRLHENRHTTRQQRINPTRDDLKE